METPEGVVFRVARTAETAAGHARELRLLPALRAWLPVRVPDPQWHAEPGAGGLPFGALGYPKLPGSTLSPELLAQIDAARLADDVAAVLVALHAFPVPDAERLGVPRAHATRPDREAVRAAVLPVLRGALSNGEYRAIARWSEEFVTDDEIERYSPALRHGDLWYGNVLVDAASGRLGAVLDWQAAAVGDRAEDLARQLHLGEGFAVAVQASYRAAGGVLEPNVEHRIRRLWERLEFEGILAAVRLGDRNELEDTLEKLRRGPILSPR